MGRQRGLGRRDDPELFYRDLMGLGRPRRRVVETFDEMFGEDQPNPTTPKGLVLASHYHVKRTCTDGKTWAAAAAATAMSPSTMDPGFLTPSGGLQFDGKLDASLVKLLDGNATTKTGSAPATTDRVHFALVDLSGDKICRPGFAGWGSTEPISGGSTAKIGIVYAAHQVVFDLQQMAIDTAGGKAVITTATGLRDHARKTAWAGFTCKPRIDDLVDITDDAAGAKVAMSAKLSGALSDLNNLGNMNSVLVWVGFEYLASLLWQSGLRHPARHGLWFPNGFQGPNPERADAACHADASSVRHWTKDPLGEKGIMLTALSVATFFTLMAQERLGDAATSRAIESVLLHHGCAFKGVLFDALPAGSVRAKKCGVTLNLIHDSALIQHDKVRYVMVCVSKNLTMTNDDRKKLYQQLDALVVANNP
jgi:hypothetical protein